MKKISRVELNLIIHRKLMHKATDERAETLNDVYQTLFKCGYVKSKLGFKNILIDTISEDFSTDSRAERLKDDIEFWYKQTDAQQNLNTTHKLTITEDGKKRLSDLANALKLDYTDFVNRASSANFANIDKFSKNKVCGIILYIQQYFDTDKEWRSAAADSIGYSTQYVSKKSEAKAKINELVDDYKNKNSVINVNKLA